MASGSRFLRIFWRSILGLVGTVLLLFGALWVTAQIPAVQRALATWVSNAAGPNVGFGRIEPSLWPGPGISIDDLYLDLDPSDPSHRAVKIASLSVVVAGWELLGGNLVVDSLHFSNANVVLDREPDGTLPIEDLIDQVLSRGDGTEDAGKEPAPDSETEGEPLGLSRLPEIEIENSAITFIDHLADGGEDTVGFSDLELNFEASHPGKPSQLDFSVQMSNGGKLSGQGSITRTSEEAQLDLDSFSIKLTGKGLPQSRTLVYLLPGKLVPGKDGTIDVTAEVSGDLGGPIDGHGVVEMPASRQFKWLGLDWMGPVRFETDFSILDTRVTLSDSSLEAAALRWKQVKTGTLTGSFDFKSDVLRVADSKLSLYGGHTSVTGDFDFQGDNPRIDANGSFSKLKFQELVFALAGEESETVFDSLEGELQVKGEIVPGSTWYDSLSGTGNILAQGGSIPSASVIGSIGGALMRLIPGFMRPGSSAGSSDTAIDHLSQDMELKDGVVHVSNAEFVTRDYTMTGDGTVDLDDRVHLRTELTFTIHGMQKLLLSLAIPLPTAGIDILPPIPILVTGTVVTPIFVPEVTALPSVAVRTLLSPVRGIARAIGSIFTGGGSADDEDKTAEEQAGP